MLSELSSRRCVVWFGQPSAEERDSLARAGWCVRIGDAQAPRSVGLRQGDMVVAMADLRSAGVDATALARLVDRCPWLPWLVVVPQGIAQDVPAVESLLRASAACFTMPMHVDRMIDVLARMGHGGGAPAEPEAIPGVVGAASPAMRRAMASLRKFAPVDLPVLITGETGSGKEVAARALHDLSPRAGHPFVAINCGALPANLVPSELFGHERGAFTGANARRIGYFEAAAGGTVFLDEIGDLPLDAQVSLLRLLQEGLLVRVGSSHPVALDVRVLAATHVDLEEAVAQGRFREDLYYRLNVLRLRMPPLREREGDVELLAQHFLEAFLSRHPGAVRTFNHGARRALRSHAWPGNVRELLNRVQRAAVVAEGPLIGAADLDLHEVHVADPAHADLGRARVVAEREVVLGCLRACGWNISECARQLKVSRVTVYRLCRKHQLRPEGPRGAGARAVAPQNM